MDNLKTYLPLLGRLLMSSLFIWDGIRQLRSPSVFAQYFASLHVPLPNVAIWISVIIRVSHIGRCSHVFGLFARFT